MIPLYDAGFLSIDKQYVTVGINGMVEAAEYLGIEPSNNEKYKAFVESQLSIIYKENKEARKTYKCLINTEFVPAENLGVKNAQWDTKYKIEKIQVQLENNKTKEFFPDEFVSLKNGTEKKARDLRENDEI
jgi:anaerobic ribonucleoside-triphosphate reductase